jgi:hypothetical protein
MYRFVGSIIFGKPYASISFSAAVGDAFGIGVIVEITFTAPSSIGVRVGINASAAFWQLTREAITTMRITTGDLFISISMIRPSLPINNGFTSPGIATSALANKDFWLHHH